MNSKKSPTKSIDLLKEVISALSSANLEQGAKLLVGLSGGPDSVALLDILCKIQTQFGIKIIAAHLDHEWRVDSWQDAEFCEQFCKNLNISLVLKKASDLNLKIRANGSQEEIARKMRQFFFKMAAQEYQTQYVLLAHHLDDQIETFLMRLMRGATLSGLGCMQAKHGLYLRPLLNATKADIYHYLAQNNLSYRIDSTNNSDKYLRNRIRKLTPLLSEVDVRFQSNFARTLNKIQEANTFIAGLAKQELEKVTENKKLNLDKFWQLEPFLQKQVLLEWLYQKQVSFLQSEKFVLEILRFLKTKNSGEHQVHQDWKLIKKHNLVDIYG